MATDLAPTLEPDRTRDTKSCPGPVTPASVSVEVQPAGSGAPATQVLNWMAEPTIRSASHCRWVVTAWPEATVRKVATAAPFVRRTAMAEELDVSSRP